MPSPSNRAIIAAAGSLKTQYVIDEALAAPVGQRVLITTYTRENCDQIIRGCAGPTAACRLISASSAGSRSS